MNNNNMENFLNNNYISKYCLDCEEYICNMCLTKKEGRNHDGHDLIDINPCDLKDSIKLWVINLQAELSNQISSVNKQLNFIGDKDFITKITLWKNNIINKLNTFETIIKNVYAKSTCVRIKYKNIDKIFNKVMQSLNKTEQEINDELYINEKTNKNYFSFDEAEIKIKKIKQNYKEIKTIKTEVKNVIDLTNINNVEKFLSSIPKSFDDLSKSSLAIITDIKNFEENNKDEDDVNNVFKYPYYFSLDFSLNRYPLLKSSNKNLANNVKKNIINSGGNQENFFLISNSKNNKSTSNYKLNGKKPRNLSNNRMNIKITDSVNIMNNQESTKFTTSHTTNNSDQILITRPSVLKNSIRISKNKNESSSNNDNSPVKINSLATEKNENNISNNNNNTRVSFKDDLKSNNGEKNKLIANKSNKSGSILKKTSSNIDGGDNKEIILPKINNNNKNTTDKGKDGGEKNNKKEDQGNKEKDSKNTTLNSNINSKGTKGKINKSVDKNNKKK